MIFDEDYNETITYEEFIDTLDAFGALREEDQAIEVANPWVPIAKRAMFWVIEVMNIRGIQIKEIFELENQDIIHFDKLKSFISNNLKVSLKRRELLAIQTELDKKLNGFISKVDTLNFYKICEK